MAYLHFQSQRIVVEQAAVVAPLQLCSFFCIIENRNSKIQMSMPSKVVSSHEHHLRSVHTLLLLVVAVSVLVIAAVAITSMQLDLFRTVTSAPSNNQVNADTYQAVFLTNNQVYFGTIDALTTDAVVLSNVYYLQVDTELQGGEGGEGEDTADDSSSLSLVKLGTNEIHSPENTMVISREQVLFWENLTKDSEVVKAIQADAAASTDSTTDE